MTMIYLASYKGTRKGFDGLVNRFIRWATKSDYSHSEICLGNPFDSPVDCISSVGAEGGVRAKTMLLSPDNWDILPLLGVDENDVLEFFAEKHGAKYDYIGCVRSILPFVSREHSERWFCSEVCAAIMGLSEPWRFHPGVLHCLAEDFI